MTPVQMCTLMGHQMTVVQPMLDIKHPLVSHLPSISEMAMSDAVMICEKVLNDAKGRVATVTTVVEETRQQLSVPQDFLFDDFVDFAEDLMESVGFSEDEMKSAMEDNKEALMEILEAQEEEEELYRTLAYEHEKEENDHLTTLNHGEDKEEELHPTKLPHEVKQEEEMDLTTMPHEEEKEEEVCPTTLPDAEVKEEEIQPTMLPHEEEMTPNTLTDVEENDEEMKQTTMAHGEERYEEKTSTSSTDEEEMEDVEEKPTIAKLFKRIHTT
ncbi:hypothetical protein J6590_030687 [Homalodisca vitripennis]|nr:hypothetical protein J6590_030687 [Homalodisca vitripennis]